MIKTKQGFRTKTLSCGCCGMYFKTWEGYQDQDQDFGYGICRECQGEAIERNNDSLDSMASQIEEALNEKNKVKFNKLSVEEKRGFAVKALDEGLFTYSFGK